LDPDEDALPFEKLHEIDRYILSVFERLRSRILGYYERMEFHSIYHAINQFVTVDASSFLLDIHKDRLYCDHPEDMRRRSAQSAIFIIAEGLCRLMAPILSFLAHEVWQHLPDWKHKDENVHLALFPERIVHVDEQLMTTWSALREVRDKVLKALEEARAAKQIGQSLDAKVVVTLPEKLFKQIEPFSDDLPQLFITSDAALKSGEAIAVAVERAAGAKCERCWNYSTAVGSHEDYPTLCDRCADVVRRLPPEVQE